MRRFGLLVLAITAVLLGAVPAHASFSVSLSTTSMTFGSTTLGNSSPAQTLTITNTGTSSLNVNSVIVLYPFYQTGFTGSTKLTAGSSLALSIYYFPTAISTQYGSISIAYSNGVASNGVSLTGTGAAASKFVVTSYPTLPSATQNSAYQAVLTASGGAGTSHFKLNTSSTLPKGLTMSSSGVISGTLDSTVAVGNYSFSLQATDSSRPPKIANATLTIPVFAVTGASCNNINWNVSGTTTPIVPLNDLGTGTYLGSQGGLYLSGSNTMPADHQSFGITAAQGIGPLDANGNPDPNGKFGFMSIGLSATQQPFIQFQSLSQTDPSLNPKMVVVNGAQGGATAAQMADLTSTFWATLLNSIIPSSGLTNNQIVVAWINDVDGGPAGTFPDDMTLLTSQLETIANNLQTKFPNIKLAYYSSFTYSGYSNGVANLDPEPYGFESGFAVKNAIADQLNGVGNLNFDPAKGAVVAPWMAWGPYYWANGMTPRSDGLAWSCQDFKPDGTHASINVGRIKVSTQLFNFFKSDPTSTPWFLAH